MSKRTKIEITPEMDRLARAYLMTERAPTGMLPSEHVPSATAWQALEDTMPGDTVVRRRKAAGVVVAAVLKAGAPVHPTRDEARLRIDKAPAPVPRAFSVCLPRGGHVVLGKLEAGDLSGVHYGNVTQAQRRLFQLGDGWEVSTLGSMHPFYVRRVSLEPFDASTADATYTVLDARDKVLGQYLDGDAAWDLMRAHPHGSVIDDRDGSIVIADTDGGQATLDAIGDRLDDHERTHVVAAMPACFSASERPGRIFFIDDLLQQARALGSPLGPHDATAIKALPIGHVHWPRQGSSTSPLGYVTRISARPGAARAATPTPNNLWARMARAALDDTSICIRPDERTRMEQTLPGIVDEATYRAATGGGFGASVEQLLAEGVVGRRRKRVARLVGLAVAGDYRGLYTSLLAKLPLCMGGVAGCRRTARYVSTYTSEFTCGHAGCERPEDDREKWEPAPWKDDVDAAEALSPHAEGAEVSVERDG